MGSNTKSILGSTLSFAGSIACMSVFGAFLTMFANAVLHADGPLKLAGFSPIATALLLGLAIALIWGGAVLVRRRLITLGVSFVALGVGLFLIANTFPDSLRIDILATLSMQSWPSAIALTAIAAGMLLLFFGLVKRHREKRA